MTERGTTTSAERIKRRQYLLLAGIGGGVLLGTLLLVSLTSPPDDRAPPSKPVSTNILAPGAQVDPRDAWRGQADAQLKAIEQHSRDLRRRDEDLEAQSEAMLKRLEQLEATGKATSVDPLAGSGLTPLPPPPISMPAARPNFGPDPVQPGTSANPPPVLPPLPPPRANDPGALAAVPGSIVSITLSAPVTQSSKGKGPSAPAPRDTRHYLPSGSFTRALLLGGLDAPTGGQSQRNPQPVLLRLMDHAVLPNQFRGRVRECFVVGAGYGDVSAERAYIRTESLSCVTRDGKAIDVAIKGYVAGEDGKAGMRGRLVSKQGQILANALLAGVASGIGTAFQQSATTLSVSPLGTTGTVDPNRQLQAGLGAGVGKALDRLAQYYITLAEKVFPVIEVDAGRQVDVVLTQGIALPAPLDDAALDELTYPQLARRASTSRRTQDEHEED